MRINKKLLIGFTLSLFLFATVVFATSSTDYFTKAKKYIDKNCNRSNPSEQISLNCYLFYKVQEIQSGTAALKVFDTNGVELGIFVDYDTFLYPTLNKLVSLDITTTGRFTLQPGGIGSVYYDQLDCAGTPYLALYQDTLTTETANALFTGFGGKYYILNNTIAPIPNKTLWSSSDGFVCDSGSANNATVKSLQEVSVSLPNPVALPLRYKYQ